MDDIAKNSRASQSKVELAWLLKKVDKIEPKIIVEIGIHRGYSLEVWKKAWPDAKVIGIENDLNSIDLEATLNCQIIDANSHETDTQYKLTSLLNGKLIDFLFIDGDHMYEGVKRDYTMYVPLVRPGGIIAFHDTGIKDNPGVEVYKFWDELSEQIGNFSTKHAEGGTGTGVLYIL